MVEKPSTLKSFLLRFPEGYIQKIDPGFDLLFSVVSGLVKMDFDEYFINHSDRNTQGCLTFCST